MTNRYNTRRRPAGATQGQSDPVRPAATRQDRPAVQQQQQQHHTTVRTDVRHNCGMCDQDLDSANCIGCDTCESWLHANEMCTGLPQALIKSLLDYGGTGVRFVCSKCRVSSCDPRAAAAPSGSPQPQSGANDELIKQLF